MYCAVHLRIDTLAYMRHSALKYICVLLNLNSLYLSTVRPKFFTESSRDKEILTRRNHTHLCGWKTLLEYTRLDKTGEMLGCECGV